MIFELEHAPDQLKKLVDEVATSGEVVLTREGKPVARLVPPTEETVTERIPGSAKGLFVVPDDFDEPLDDFRDYM
jgi:prevent-host-death family protein